MSKLFVSHSSQDDGFVRELQQALNALGKGVWIDSRELVAGDLLWPEIQKAIEEASAYAIVVSTNALQSKWVGKELRHALAVQKERGKDDFPVIPLSLDGTKLGVLEEIFGDEPIYASVSSQAGGVDAALKPILVAMGKMLPGDLPPGPQPKAELVEELVLELTDLKFSEQAGLRRAAGRARLIYEPAAVSQREVASERWRFVTPLGPIEAEELRWYLEKYAIWPSEYFRDRARKVEQSLVEWGRRLYSAALPVAYTVDVLQAWSRVDANAARRFSVHVDATLEADSPLEDVEAAREAATVLLGLPWELLHDGDGFLFQGARPICVRRRLPNTRNLNVLAMSTPIRILLVTARPEDDACGYFDHRASALPLVEAIEGLGGLVDIHVLNPPTLRALSDELERAQRARAPYHVVHFDGYGVYNHRVGLGGLCFEDPQDVIKLDKRRHITVTTAELGPLLRDYRIPLIFLGAFRSAATDQIAESIASEMLKIGAASVASMSHSVLVETGRRFVEAFYAALARGARVGDGMLQGQRRLKEDTFRDNVFSVGELRLEDWFVPVLFQEKADPQLFEVTPQKSTESDIRAVHAGLLGDLPPPPGTGFIGNSREILALERLLAKDRYAVVLGQGGEGKTALATESARWMVRSHQVRRAAFVSVEANNSLAEVLRAIGRQLLPDYSETMFDELERATREVERVLAEQTTLLIMDNMESILRPPYVETPVALSEEAQHELNDILALCARLMQAGSTRIVFSSREALPAPFDSPRHRRELGRLHRDDAVKLVERTLNVEKGDDGIGGTAYASRESIEALVDAVHGHARTLALLGPALRSQGVDATRESLTELMATMEKKFPGSREHSLFASVELSLRRLSPVSLKKVRVLGVFVGGVQLNVLRALTPWEGSEVDLLVRELVETGLAT
ncbi:MAG TPA: TIR domain-containing protein, partial [Pyrinomonadaceae bacterium]